MDKYIIENCANSVESAIEAQKGGALRVELCAGIPEGGTTPSYGDILMARKHLDIALHVIIRPRGGDFLYSPLEQEIMLADIRTARQLGADGIVLGCLTTQGEVDMPLMRRMIEEADGMAVTFHRAFDMVRDYSKALENIISLGCQRILTSGGKPTAILGADQLKACRQQAAGRIIIMPGCGVNPGNIRKLAEATGCHEFHFSGRKAMESGMEYRNPEVFMGGEVKVEEYKRDVTDANKIAAALAALPL